METDKITVHLSQKELELISEALWHLQLESDKNSKKTHVKHLRECLDIFLKKRESCKELILKLKK